MEFSKEVLRVGDEKLRAECADWTSETVSAAKLKELIHSMREIMHKEGGVGLAAPQVGVHLNLFIMECVGNSRYPSMPEIPFQAVINPRILRVARRTSWYEEGCLSVPGCRIGMIRPSHLQVHYLDASLKPCKKRFKGLESRIFQHEYDHLSGILLVDYLPEDLQEELISK